MKSIEICKKILALLIKYKESEWIKTFLSFIKAMEESDEDTAKREILKIYGGMGSFNDLVLYENNLPSNVANDKLSQLRDALYESII